MTSTGFLAGAAIALMLALPAGAQVVASSSGGAAGSLVGKSSANGASLDPDRAANRPAAEAGSQSATTSTAGAIASASAPYVPALLNSGASRRNDQQPATLAADVGADDEVLAGAPKSTAQNFAGANDAGVVSKAATNEPVVVSP